MGQADSHTTRKMSEAPPKAMLLRIVSADWFHQNKATQYFSQPQKINVSWALFLSFWVFVFFNADNFSQFLIFLIFSQLLSFIVSWTVLSQQLSIFLSWNELHSLYVTIALIQEKKQEFYQDQSDSHFLTDDLKKWIENHTSVIRFFVNYASCYHY